MCYGTVVYVTFDGGGNGSDWENPCTLDYARENAANGQEIWVQGSADQTATHTLSNNSTFSIKTNMKVLGGFCGNETSADARNPKVYATAISGENQYRVFESANDATGWVVDGVTIAGTAGSNGAVLCVYGGAGTVSNCNIRNNRATGGAIVYSTGDLELVDCFITHNTGLGAGAHHLIRSDGGSYPGGLLSLTNCVISHNTVTQSGSLSKGSIVRCGGEDGGDAQIVHCTIDGNETADKAILYCNYTGEMTVTNTIFSANTSSGTHTVVEKHNNGTVSGQYCLFGNTDPTQNKTGGGASNALPGITGGTIYSNDPAYTNAASDNYVLKSGSYAIDRGTDAGVDHDIEDRERPQGDDYDIGAYEYCPGRVIYVVPYATGPGTSWANACSLERYRSPAYAPNPCENDTLWLKGRSGYHPSHNIWDTLTVTGGMRILGGFAGNETSESQRNAVDGQLATNIEINIGGYPNRSGFLSPCGVSGWEISGLSACFWNAQTEGGILWVRGDDDDETLDGTIQHFAGDGEFLLGDYIGNPVTQSLYRFEGDGCQVWIDKSNLQGRMEEDDNGPYDDSSTGHLIQVVNGATLSLTNSTFDLDITMEDPTPTDRDGNVFNVSDGGTIYLRWCTLHGLGACTSYGSIFGVDDGAGGGYADVVNCIFSNTRILQDRGFVGDGVDFYPNKCLGYDNRKNGYSGSWAQSDGDVVWDWTVDPQLELKTIGLYPYPAKNAYLPSEDSPFLDDGEPIEELPFGIPVDENSTDYVEEPRVIGDGPEIGYCEYDEWDQ